MFFPKGSFFKRSLQNLLLVVFSLGLFLLLSEAILSLFNVHPAPSSLEHSLGLPPSENLYIPQGDSFSTNPKKHLLFNYQSFPVVKQKNAVRIFTLGGSTTYGRPYDDGVSFSGWLRAYLKELEPETPWEVINSGGISYASYRIAGLVEELIQYDPDLFILYSGHNEFLEERTLREINATPRFIRSLDRHFSKTRLYTFLKRGYGHLAPKTPDTTTSNLPPEVVTKLENTIGPTSYERNDSLKRLIHEHYRNAVTTIIDICRNHKVPLLLIRTPSNLKDCSPFKSEPDAALPPERYQTFKSAYASGLNHYQRGEYPQAEAALRRAVDADPRHSHAHYYLGKTLLETGKTEEAAEHFTRARDEDVCPLRADSKILEIQTMLGQNASVHYLDWNKVLEEQSRQNKGHPILGEEEFLDHVHLSIESHQKLALEILNIMDSSGLFSLPEQNRLILAAASRSIYQKLDNQSRGRALHNLAKVTHWAGKHEDALRLARKALTVDTLDKDAFTSFFLVGTALHRQDQLDSALKYYRGAFRIDSNNHRLNQYMGKLYLKQNNHPMAYRHFSLALRTQPENLELHQELGLLSFRLKKFDEALVHFKGLVARRPGSPNLRYNLGKAFLLKGDVRRAAAAWSEALRLDPNHAGALAGLRQLTAPGSGGKPRN